MKTSVLAAASLALLGCAYGQSAGDIPIAEGVNAAVSPDGTKIAFQRYVGNQSHLAIRDLASGEERWIERGANGAIHPTWSPDGSLVYAYCTVTNTAFQKWIRPKVGGGWVIRRYKDGVRTNLTQTEARDFTPCVSPDGKKVYFATTRGVHNSKSLFSMSQHIAVADLASGEAEILAYAPGSMDAGCSQPVVSPDGRFLVWAQIGSFTDCWRLYGATLGHLDRAICLLPEGMVAYAPRWCPDGRTIAFTGYRDGDEGWCVYLTDILSGDFRKVCRGDNPSFTPDGRALVYDCGGKIYRHAIADSEWPRRDPAPETANPCAEPERVVWRADAPANGAKIPFPQDLAFERGDVFFVRIALHWSDSGQTLQRFFAGAYGDSKSSEQALQLYRDPHGVPSFATRTADDFFTYVQIGAPMKEEGDYTFTGVVAGNELFISQNGGWPKRCSLSQGMITLKKPLYALLGRDVGTSNTKIQSVEIGRGWPKDVPNPKAMMRKEMFK